MKSIKELKQEVNSILQEIEQQKSYDTKQSRTAIKRLKAKLAYTKTCLRYIESEPTKEFMEKERERLSNRVTAFMRNYVALDAERFMKSDVSKHKKNYEKEMGIPKLRKQLTTLNYLLK